MNNKMFRRIVSAAESNDINAIKSLMKLSLRDDWYGDLASQELRKLGVKVERQVRRATA